MNARGPRACLECILLVEDNPGDARLVAEMLRDAVGRDFGLHHVERLQQGLERLVHPGVSCVLLDISLPDAQGLEGLQRVRKVDASVPVLVLTGRDDEALGAQAVREGAQDYLVKGQVSGDTIVRAIRFAVERKQSEAQLAHRALHDPLTGLPNRPLLLDRLALALARLDRRPSQLALLFLDIDRFKLVNDSFGHDAGDRVLIEVAERLQHAMRPGDTVARLGGDEYVLVCEDVAGEADAAEIARRLQAALTPPIRLGDRELMVSASVGIALASDAGQAEAALLRDADLAMYQAKRHQGNRYEFFDEVMRTQAQTRLATQQGLSHALEHGDLEVFYQPWVSFATGGITGVEALVRWHHLERGLVYPVDFIAVAEETRLIQPLGAWVLDEACAQLARWRLFAPATVPPLVSVNLSPLQMVRSDLVETVTGALAASGIEPSALCLEITETVVMEEARSVTAVLSGLADMGVRLAIDDFGTGYSSLRSLRRFPVRMVKIDRSFIGGLESSDDDVAIVAAVLGLAEALGLEAVAEGVETPGQLARLRELGCLAGQGYHFATPEPAAALLPLFGRTLTEPWAEVIAPSSSIRLARAKSKG